MITHTSRRRRKWQSSFQCRARSGRPYNARIQQYSLAIQHKSLGISFVSRIDVQRALVHRTSIRETKLIPRDLCCIAGEYCPGHGGSLTCRFSLSRRYRLAYTPGTRFAKYLTTILRLSYDSAEVSINLRSTYDGRLIYKTSYNERALFVGKIHVQNRNIVGDSVRNLAYDIPERNFSTF